MTPMSWVISTMAVPVSRLQLGHQVEDLGLHGDVERGGRLVGDQQLGAAGHGRGDHHPLAHAAGELVRVLAQAARGVGDAHLLQPQLGARRRRRASDRPRCRRRGSAICSPIRTCGVSAVSGSWKIMVIFEPRMRLSSRGFRPSSSWPWNFAEPLGAAVARPAGP